MTLSCACLEDDRRRRVIAAFASVVARNVDDAAGLLGLCPVAKAHALSIVCRTVLGDDGSIRRLIEDLSENLLDERLRGSGR